MAAQRLEQLRVPANIAMDGIPKTQLYVTGRVAPCWGAERMETVPVIWAWAEGARRMELEWMPIADDMLRGLGDCDGSG